MSHLFYFQRDSFGNNSNGKIRQQGFTFIELMAAVVIVGILAAVALPSYVQEYTIRAKIIEGILLAGGLGTAIETKFQLEGPSDMSCIDATSCAVIGAAYVSPTKSVDSVVSDESGVITVTYNTSVLPAGANVLVIAPAAPSGTPFNLHTGAAGTRYVWDCGRASAAFSINGAGLAGTTVANNFLPAGCRQ